MAESMTKKTTAKSSTSKAKNTVVEEKREIIEEKKEVVEEKKTFEPTDLIECVSVTAGELIFFGRKTKNIYRWTDYGDTQEVEYQDLKSEKLNKTSRYIYDPLFMINDEDVLNSPEFSGVSDVYQSFLSIDDIDEIFNLDLGNFKRIISELPVGLKNTIKSLAVTKIENGSLDSVKKIKCIDEVLGTDLFNSYLNE